MGISYIFVWLCLEYWYQDRVHIYACLLDINRIQCHHNVCFLFVGVAVGVDGEAMGLHKRNTNFVGFMYSSGGIISYGYL